jgi:hypothetical protein
MTSNGINVLRHSSFLNAIRIQDTSILLPMIDTRRNIFSRSRWGNERLKAMSNQSCILLLIITKVWSVRWGKNLTYDTLYRGTSKKYGLQMEHNKPPVHDGFPAEFFWNLWEIIKLRLLELFGVLHSIQLELLRLNLGKIILLPKVNEAERVPIILVYLSS